MKILLINPNRYHSPPTPPIGLEYLVSPLEEHGHEVNILDLCFSNDVWKDCKNAVAEIQPHLIGVTIRNIDTALYPQTQLFLDEIREIITYMKHFNIPVVVGGSGYSALPEDVLAYVRADFGISGPGEGALPALAGMIGRDEAPRRILKGWEYPFDPALTHRRIMNIDYKRYREGGGVAGFETQKGCPEGCVYCIEARTRHRLRAQSEVVKEILTLVEMENSSFHLCDCEFNISLPGCIEFLKTLISTKVSIEWSLYMKPEPISEELFILLKASGAQVVTLTVNSYELEKPDYRKAVIQCIDYARKTELALTVDLLVGFPFESADSMCKTIDFFRKHRPVSVGVNFYIRIYSSTALFSYFQQNPDLQSSFIRPYENDSGFIRPVFYRHPSASEIAEWIADDPVFRLEGIEKGTNYQRFQYAADKKK